MVILIFKNGFLDLDFVKYFILLGFFISMQCTYIYAVPIARHNRAGGWGLGSQDSRNTRHLPDAE